MSAAIQRGRDLDQTPEAKALTTYLEALSLDQIKELQVLMYTGRGDYDAREWRRACGELPMSGNKEVEIEQLIEKTPLAEYLMDGFDQINLARII
jgi:hypothetical protein